MILLLIAKFLIAKLLFIAVMGLIGSAALACAVFLNEPEEKAFQERINRFWIGVDDRRKRGEQSPIAAKIAAFIGKSLDRIVGEPLISFRMANISFGASLLTYGLVLVGGMLLGVHFPDKLLLLMFLLVTIVVPVLFFLVISKWPRAKSADFILILAIAIWVLIPYGRQPYRSGFDLIAGSLAGIGCSILFLAVARRLLRKLATKATFLLAVGAGAFQFAVLILFAGLPIFLCLKLGWPRYGQTHGNPPWIIPELVFIFNMPTILLSLAFLGMMAFLPLHKLFWPTLSRLIYPLARFEIVRNRKVMVGIAAFCLAAISAPAAEIFKKIIDLFH